MLRHRRLVLAAWIVVFLIGGFASSKLSAILSNTFSVPGTASETVRHDLEVHYGDRSDGSFTVVFELPKGAASDAPALRQELATAVGRAAAAVPGGKPLNFNVATTPAGKTVVYGDISSTLNLAQAKGYTDKVIAALGTPTGVENVYVTGAAAIQHDLDPVFNRDLKHGELAIAVPIALLVLLAVFGLSWAVTIPLIFAACTITGTLGIVYGVASIWATPTYATNLVQLIGLGIAVDYSLLIVYRFREELAGGLEIDEAVVRTMQTAGRAVVFSGIAVALGLSLLVAMPLPFIRMLGVAGFLIPVVSIVGAVTLQPVLLSYYGRKGTVRHRLLRREPKATRRRLLGAACPLDHEAAARLPRLRLGRADRDGGACDPAPADAGIDVRHPAHLPVGEGLRPAPGGGRARRRRAGTDPRDQPRRAGARRADASRGQAARRRARAGPGGGEGLHRHDEPLHRLEPALRADPRRRPSRLRLPRGPGVRQTAPRRPDPGRRLSRDDPGARRRRARPGGRLPPSGLHLLRAADLRGARADLLPADARVPLAASSAQGGAAQPALGGRRVRDARGVLPLRARPGSLRPLPVLPGRGLDPDLPLRDAVRPLDGLRGVPGHADARGLGRGRRQRDRGRARAREDRADHHRGRDHHVRRVLRVRRRQHRRPAGVRARPRSRDLRRCDDRSLPARAEHDGDPRPLELVASRGAREARSRAGPRRSRRISSPPSTRRPVSIASR